MQEMGVAVVGYGMGAYHCKQIRQVEGLRLQVVVDSEESRRAAAATEQGVPAYASLEEALDDPTVGLVVLATPHHTHAPMAIQALTAGRHVVVEKPMCLNLAEADAMLEAARHAGRTLTVHQNRRFDSDYLTARQVLLSGILGPIYQIEAASDFRGPHTGWRAEARHGGGYLYDAGSHVIDQVVQLVGCRATTVFADLQRRVWIDTMDTETHAHLTVRFERGMVGVIEVSGIAWHRKPRWLIQGEQGTFVKQDWGGGAGFVYTQVADLPAKIEVEPVPGDWVDYYRMLADHLLHGTALHVRPEEVRETIKIIQAAFRSAELGQSVDVVGW